MNADWLSHEAGNCLNIPYRAISSCKTRLKLKPLHELQLHLRTKRRRLLA